MQILDHPKLGKLRGKVECGIKSFYGLQYATLRHRFDDPSPILRYAVNVYDATSPGPIATPIPDACALEQDLIQGVIPHQKFKFSELESLNLSIHIPVTVAQDLPILVFIHGGGFVTGSHAWPQYDLKRTVQQSIRDGRPVIAVGINYRLGIPGFLYSRNLQNAGIKPNRGLIDQKMALQWIRRNVDGFGGDVKKITVMGESAGSVSIMYHLQEEEPLFSQMISMSGSLSLITPSPPPVFEAAYATVLTSLNIHVQDAGEQLRALRKISLHDMLTRIPPSVSVGPSASYPPRTQFPSLTDLMRGSGNVPGMAWCERIMIGDCRLDVCVKLVKRFDAYVKQGSIFAQLVEFRQSDNADNFRQAVMKAVEGDQDLTRSILETYKMQKTIESKDSNRAIMQFISDIGFYIPVICTAHSWPGKAFVYHFNEPNPWEGPFKGYATHILDVAFALQNYDEQLPDSQRISAQLMSHHFIKFVNGEDPFPLYRGLNSGGARVYGSDDEAGFIVSEYAESYGRKQEVWDLVHKIGPDKLMAAVQNFLLS